MADSNFSYVAVLAKFTTNGAVSTFTDTVGKTFTGYGDAQVVTSASMLTGHALSLDGTGDYLDATGANVVVLGTGVATIDCELIVSGYGYIIASRGDSNSWGLFVDPSGFVNVIFQGGAVKSGAVAINDGLKHHVALVGSGSNTWALYIDGVRDGATFTYGNTFTTTPTHLTIGAEYTGVFEKFIAAQIGYVRVTPGIARWTENFTPPTLADLGAIYSKTMTTDMSVGVDSGAKCIFPVSVDEYLTADDKPVGIWFSKIAGTVSMSAAHAPRLQAVEHLMQSLAISAGVASRAIFGESLNASISISSAAAAKLLANASITAGVKLYTAEINAGDIDDAIQTWCANLATSAHSRYAQYGFNSFARWGGKHYGCKSDGIFELGGDTDGADPIPWTVTLAETDFGMDQLKRLPYVYVGAKATGDLVLKVIEGPGAIHFFDIEMSSREDRAGRATLARGLSGRYWKIEIASDTERVELDAIEFFPVKVSRRI